MALEVKKIYVDSRYRAADSNSDSDFRIQLGRNIFLPEKCVYHLENCVIPHSWYNTEKDLNDTLYFIYNGNAIYNAVAIPSTNYTGASLAAAFNNVLDGLLTLTYDLNTNKITITSSYTFQILTDYDLLHIQFNR